VNFKYAFFTALLVSGVIALTLRSAPPQEKAPDPSRRSRDSCPGSHKLDGKVMGPYHHYCKAV